MRTGIIKQPHATIPVGTIIACDNGHPVAEVISLIGRGLQYAPSKQIGKFVGKPPKSDAQLPLRCDKCGACWICYEILGGVTIHFQELGWWPFEPSDAVMTEVPQKKKWWQFWKRK